MNRRCKNVRFLYARHLALEERFLPVSLKTIFCVLSKSLKWREEKNGFLWATLLDFQFLQVNYSILLGWHFFDAFYRELDEKVAFWRLTACRKGCPRSWDLITCTDTNFVETKGGVAVEKKIFRTIICLCACLINRKWKNPFQSLINVWSFTQIQFLLTNNQSKPNLIPSKESKATI